MRSLLDVNILIALLDADHASHRAALEWFKNHAEDGWASCPITQNGCVRIMSHPSYPYAPPITAVVERLRAATAHPAHEFWADDLSLLDEAAIDTTRIHGSRQLTDAYLLGLAVRHNGRLATFDSAILMSAVVGAKPRHLLTL